MFAHLARFATKHQSSLHGPSPDLHGLPPGNKTRKAPASAKAGTVALYNTTVPIGLTHVVSAIFADEEGQSLILRAVQLRSWRASHALATPASPDTPAPWHLTRHEVDNLQKTPAASIWSPQAHGHPVFTPESRVRALANLPKAQQSIPPIQDVLDAQRVLGWALLQRIVAGSLRYPTCIPGNILAPRMLVGLSPNGRGGRGLTQTLLYPDSVDPNTRKHVPPPAWMPLTSDMCSAFLDDVVRVLAQPAHLRRWVSKHELPPATALMGFLADNPPSPEHPWPICQLPVPASNGSPQGGSGNGDADAPAQSRRVRTVHAVEAFVMRRYFTRASDGEGEDTGEDAGEDAKPPHLPSSGLLFEVDVPLAPFYAGHPVHEAFVGCAPIWADPEKFPAADYLTPTTGTNPDGSPRLPQTWRVLQFLQDRCQRFAWRSHYTPHAPAHKPSADRSTGYLSVAHWPCAEEDYAQSFIPHPDPEAVEPDGTKAPIPFLISCLSTGAPPRPGTPPPADWTPLQSPAPAPAPTPTPTTAQNPVRSRPQTPQTLPTPPTTQDSAPESPVPPAVSILTSEDTNPALAAQARAMESPEVLAAYLEAKARLASPESHPLMD